MNTAERRMQPKCLGHSFSCVVGFVGDTLRSIVRASAIAGFLVALIAHLVASETGGGVKTLAAQAADFVVLPSVLSLGASVLVAVVVLFETKGRTRQSTGWYVVLNFVTLLLGLTTPSIR